MSLNSFVLWDANHPNTGETWDRTLGTSVPVARSGLPTILFRLEFSPVPIKSVMNASPETNTQDTNPNKKIISHCRFSDSFP
jgi:hypothetical protein